MDVEEEALVRLEFVQPLLDEHAVGAEVDVLVAFEDPATSSPISRIDHRLAAADADDRGAALIDRRQAFLDAELLLDGRLVLADAPAAGAGQVAGVQRFEHQHEREALPDHGVRLAMWLRQVFDGQDAKRIARVRP